MNGLSRPRPTKMRFLRTLGQSVGFSHAGRERERERERSVLESRFMLAVRRKYGMRIFKDLVV